LPDAKKGEQVILVTTHKQATINDLMAASPGAHISLPKKILIVDSIPVMAAGNRLFSGYCTGSGLQLKVGEVLIVCGKPLHRLSFCNRSKRLILGRSPVNFDIVSSKVNTALAYLSGSIQWGG